MLLSKVERAQRQINKLPAIALQANEIEFIHQPSQFKQQILTSISQAKKRIYITALYWEQDEAGQEILAAVYAAKQRCPALEIGIFVDWHRAQRGRIGEENGHSNADWYAQLRQQYAIDDIPIYGIPINTREVFGVLHIKGFIFDDTVLYSGASINNVYLQQKDRYRYDRYQKITQPQLADSLVTFIHHYLNDISAVGRLDQTRKSTKELRQTIRHYRKMLAQQAHYVVENGTVMGKAELAVSPLFGLGKGNILNKTIESLFNIVTERLTICTPYFNFPRSLRLRLKTLLETGKFIEIIVGDKTANDFYIPQNEPFKMIGALPYLYEQNLRKFCKQFDQFIQNGQLTVRLWKDQDNSYHLKGVWVDKDYILLTGNNLNPRAWRLDAENGLLLQDPQHLLSAKTESELMQIRIHTTKLHSYKQLERLIDYPYPVQKLLKRIARVKMDHIVRMIL